MQDAPGRHGLAGGRLDRLLPEPVAAALPGVGRQRDVRARRAEDRVPAQSDARLVELGGRAREREARGTIAADAADGDRPAAALLERLADVAQEDRMRPDLDEDRHAVGDHRVDRGTQEHGVAQVASPVRAVEALGMQAPAGDGRVQRQRAVAGAQAGQRGGELAVAAVQQGAVEAVLDEQALAARAGRGGGARDAFHGRRMAGDDRRARAVDRGDRDARVRARVEQPLNLVRGQADADHRPAARSAFGDATAAHEQVEGLRAIDRSRDAGGEDLAHAVAGDRVGLDAARAPQCR